MDNSLKTMVIEAVNNTYVFALYNVFTGYMGSSTQEIMNHIMALYWRITAVDTKIKKKTSKKP